MRFTCSGMHFIILINTIKTRIYITGKGTLEGDFNLLTKVDGGISRILS